MLCMLIHTRHTASHSLNLCDSPAFPAHLGYEMVAPKLRPDKAQRQQQFAQATASEPGQLVCSQGV